MSNSSEFLASIKKVIDEFYRTNKDDDAKKLLDHLRLHTRITRKELVFYEKDILHIAKKARKKYKIADTQKTTTKDKPKKSQYKVGTDKASRPFPERYTENVIDISDDDEEMRPDRDQSLQQLSSSKSTNIKTPAIVTISPPPAASKSAPNMPNKSRAGQKVQAALVTFGSPAPKKQQQQDVINPSSQNSKPLDLFFDEDDEYIPQHIAKSPLRSPSKSEDEDDEYIPRHIAESSPSSPSKSEDPPKADVDNEDDNQDEDEDEDEAGDVNKKKQKTQNQNKKPPPRKRGKEKKRIIKYYETPRDELLTKSIEELKQILVKNNAITREHPLPKNQSDIVDEYFVGEKCDPANQKLCSDESKVCDARSYSDKRPIGFCVSLAKINMGNRKSPPISLRIDGKLVYCSKKFADLMKQKPTEAIHEDHSVSESVELPVPKTRTGPGSLARESLLKDSTAQEEWTTNGYDELLDSTTSPTNKEWSTYKTAGNACILKQTSFMKLLFDSVVYEEFEDDAADRLTFNLKNFCALVGLNNKFYEAKFKDDFDLAADIGIIDQKPLVKHFYSSSDKLYDLLTVPGLESPDDDMGNHALIREKLNFMASLNNISAELIVMANKLTLSELNILKKALEYLSELQRDNLQDSPLLVPDASAWFAICAEEVTNPETKKIDTNLLNEPQVANKTSKERFKLTNAFVKIAPMFRRLQRMLLTEEYLGDVPNENDDSGFQKTYFKRLTKTHFTDRHKLLIYLFLASLCTNVLEKRRPLKPITPPELVSLGEPAKIEQTRVAEKTDPYKLILTPESDAIQRRKIFDLQSKFVKDLQEMVRMQISQKASQPPPDNFLKNLGLQPISSASHATSPSNTSSIADRFNFMFM